MRVLITLFAGFLAFAPVAAIAQPTITVVGEGTVEAVPDIVTLSLGVNHQAPSARAALDQVAKDSRAIIAILTDFGIDASDIATTGLSLNQVYDRRNNNNEPPKVVGFAVSNRLSVTLHDIENLGQLLDRIVDAGANWLGGIQFGVSDRETRLQEARKNAVNKALSKAKTYAEAAGLELGDIIEITESSGAGAPRPAIRMQALAADSMPIAPGSEQLSVQIWIKISLR